MNQETSHSSKPSGSSGLLTAYVVRLREALQADADEHQEPWSPGRNNLDTGTSGLQKVSAFRLTGEELDSSQFPPASTREAAEVSYAGKLAAATHVVIGAAARALVPRLEALHQHAAAQSGIETSKQVLEKVREFEADIRVAMEACFTDRKMAAVETAFKDALDGVPNDIVLFTLFPNELAETYWQGLLKVLSDYVEADVDYLDSVKDYTAQARNAVAVRRYAFLDDQRKHLTKRLESLIIQLDGKRLHADKESLRKQLDLAEAALKLARANSQGKPVAEEGSTTTGERTLFGKLLGRAREYKPAGVDTVTSMFDAVSKEVGRDVALEELEREVRVLKSNFESLDDVRQDLLTERNRIRAEIEAIDAEFSAASVDRSKLDFWGRAVQPRAASQAGGQERARQPAETHPRAVGPAGRRHGQPSEHPALRKETRPGGEDTRKGVAGRELRRYQGRHRAPLESLLGRSIEAAGGVRGGHQCRLVGHHRSG